MKIKEILERIDWDETPREYPNPLPSIGVGDPQFDAFDEKASEVDGLMVAIFKKENGLDNISGQEYGRISKEQRLKYGQVTEIPVNKLIAAEPYLDGEHLNKILSGQGTKDKNDLPIVYKIDGKYYIGDGNHRAAADVIKGNKTVRALLIDADKLIPELEKML